jgi:hypothetical protein
MTKNAWVPAAVNSSTTPSVPTAMSATGVGTRFGTSLRQSSHPRSRALGGKEKALVRGERLSFGSESGADHHGFDFGSVAPPELIGLELVARIEPEACITGDELGIERRPVVGAGWKLIEGNRHVGKLVCSHLRRAVAAPDPAVEWQLASREEERTPERCSRRGVYRRPDLARCLSGVPSLRQRPASGSLELSTKKYRRSPTAVSERSPELSKSRRARVRPPPRRSATGLIPRTILPP